VPGGLRIAILGPLEVRAGPGLPVEVAGARLRRLLLRPAAGVGQAELRQQLGRPAPGGGARLAEQAADQQEVLDAGEALVDGRVLAGEGDQLADLLGLGDDVVAADQGPAVVRLEQGCQDTDRGGLAGPVGAEHGQDGAGPCGQVHPVKGGGVAEPLDQAVGLDGVVHDAPLVGCSGASCAGALTCRSHPADTPRSGPRTPQRSIPWSVRRG
jgi:hypothetical protein